MRDWARGGRTRRHGAVVVVGAGLAFAAGVVSFAEPVRPAAGARLRLVRDRGPRDRGRGPAPPRADPPVHPRVHDRLHAAGRVRRRLRPLPATRGSSVSPGWSWSAGALMLGTRSAAARPPCSRSGGRSSTVPARARPARSRSGGGVRRRVDAVHRARARRDARDAAGGSVKGACCWPCTPSASGCRSSSSASGPTAVRASAGSSGTTARSPRSRGRSSSSRRRPADDGDLPAVHRAAGAVRAGL